MKIWKLHRQFEKYEILKFSNEKDSDFFHQNFKGVPIKESWEQILVEIYQGGEESDFPDGLLSPPIFSERTVQKLGEFLDGNDVELLPLHTIKNKKYYAVNVLKVLDCIDGDRSEVKRFRSGEIMKYKKYAFKEDQVKGQDIFKLVDHEEKKIFSTQIFVSDRFRDKVKESGLTGFDFIKVWDSNEYDMNPEQNGLTFSGEDYTFEEALAQLEQNNEIFYSEKWAIRYGEDREFEVGQFQGDGNYSWVTPVYTPPIFLGMKWYKKS